MATLKGPSLSGPLSSPLTGWTSSSLAPKSSAVPGVKQAVSVQTATQEYQQAKAALDKLPPGNTGKTPEQLTELANLQRKVATTRRTLNDAVAGDDPAKQVKARLANLSGVLSTDIAGDTFKVGANDPSLAAPALVGSPQQFSQTGSGGGNLSQYDLTANELGGGLGPDPRRAVTPSTGLESMLAALFPDAAAGAVGPNPLADPRNPGAAPSLMNTILGNLGQPPVASQVGGPSFAGPTSGTGAQIAATIPGAPAFLGGAINNVQGGGYGSGYFAPPTGAPMGSLGQTLAGVAAVSAEQRLQQQIAQQQAQQAAAQHYEQVRAQQAQMDEAARLQRLRGGVGGWNAPINTTETQAWLQGYRPPTQPAFQPYVPNF